MLNTSQTSFGFGQVGGSVLIVHPRYVIGAVDPAVYSNYKARNRERALASYKAMTSMMTTNTLVKIKEAPPYSKDLEESVLLNSLARAKIDEKTGSYSFPKKLATKFEYNLANADILTKALQGSGASVGVGVDHGEANNSRYFGTFTNMR